MPNPNEPTRPGEPPRPPPFEPPRPQPPQPRPPPIEVPQRPPIEVPQTPPIEVPETPPRGRRAPPPGAYGPILCDTRGPSVQGNSNVSSHGYLTTGADLLTGTDRRSSA